MGATLKKADLRPGDWPEGSAWMHVLWCPKPAHPWGAMVFILEVVGIRETWEVHVEMPASFGASLLRKLRAIPDVFLSDDGVAIPVGDTMTPGIRQAQINAEYEAQIQKAADSHLENGRTDRAVDPGDPIPHEDQRR